MQQRISSTPIKINREQSQEYLRELAREGLFRRLPLTGLEESIHLKVCGFVALMRAVLDRILLDALTHKSIKQRVSAREYVSLSNKDFLQVCELAVLDPDFVYRHFFLALNLLTEKEN